jgi:beta-glucanase (GH16 family)
MIKHLFIASCVLLFAAANVFSQTKARKGTNNVDSVDPGKPDYTSPRVIEGYQLVWSDEFNYKGKPDPSKWDYEIGFKRNKELQWYQPDNANCIDGVLLIEGRKEKRKNETFDASDKDWRTSRKFIEYTSSSVLTKNKAQWKYGRFEIRARIDTSLGSWPAIWTLGVENQWPANGEIDILEFYIKNGQQSILANCAHKGKKEWEAVWDSKITPLSYFLEKDPDWHNKFHVWSMDWTEDGVWLYLDDELLNETLNKHAVNPDGFKPFTQPHYLLLNLALGSNGGDPSNSRFPITFEVDYVRIWQEDLQPFQADVNDSYQVKAMYSSYPIGANTATKKVAQQLPTSTESVFWSFKAVGSDAYQIINTENGQYLTAANEAEVTTVESPDEKSEWVIVPTRKESFIIKNRHTGKVLSIKRSYSLQGAKTVLSAEDNVDPDTYHFYIQKKKK